MQFFFRFRVYTLPNNLPNEVGWLTWKTNSCSSLGIAKAELVNNNIENFPVPFGVVDIFSY